MTSRILRFISPAFAAVALAGVFSSCSTTDDDSTVLDRHIDRGDTLFDRHLDRAYKIDEAFMKRREKMSNRADAAAAERWDRLTR